MLKLDLIHTLAFGGIILFLGYGLRRLIPPLARYNLGFMLGTTANAMAVMRTLVERYGPAPRAFLVAPMVGAFFIDFTNALIITACLNIFR